jgi:hypothetical protein
VELARELMYERLPSVHPGQDGARPALNPGNTFGDWFDRFLHAAHCLAKFQSPTLKAVAVKIGITLSTKSRRSALAIRTGNCDRLNGGR